MIPHFEKFLTITDDYRLNRYYQLHVVVAVLLFLTAAFFSYGYHHFDEHFQILEFAGLKLGLTSPEVLPWEYQRQMRPTLHPWLTVLLIKPCLLYTSPSPRD